MSEAQPTGVTQISVPFRPALSRTLRMLLTCLLTLPTERDCGLTPTAVKVWLTFGFISRLRSFVGLVMPLPDANERAPVSTFAPGSARLIVRKVAPSSLS